jgi:hypothetical protein
MEDVVMVNIGDTAYLFGKPQGVVEKINYYKNGNIKTIVYKNRSGYETDRVTVNPRTLDEKLYPTTFKKETA